MITTGAKLWFAVLAAAMFGTVLNVLTGGGDYATFVLGSVVVAAGGLGMVLVANRDGEIGVDEAPVPSPGPDALPGSAPWPALAGLGVAVSLAGLATGGALMYVGFALLSAVFVEWMVQAWSERSTADPTTNQALRNRLMYPLEIPVLALAAAAFVVLGFSRVLLALPKIGSTVVAIVVAGVILGVAALIASRPRITSSMLTGIVTVASLVLVGGSVVGAVAGEREFHEVDGEDESGGGGEGSGTEELVVSASSETAFDQETLAATTGDVTIVFENLDDDQLHNFRLTDFDAATEIISGGETDEVVVDLDEPGDYTYTCDVHPEMTGTLEVTDS